jgi:hypothetical protein
VQPRQEGCVANTRVFSRGINKPVAADDAGIERGRRNAGGTTRRSSGGGAAQK